MVLLLSTDSLLDPMVMSTMVEVMFNLLGLDNYRNSSKDAGVDLEKYPDKMLDPVISARVLIRGIMDGRWNGQGKGY